MSRDVEWTYLAWKDLTSLHWRTAGNVCRAVYNFAEDGIGTLRKFPPDEGLGATHSLVVPPFTVYVSLDATNDTPRVWRVRRYIR